MGTKPNRKANRWILALIWVPLGICLLTAAVSALSNIGLAEQSSELDALSTADQNRIAEAQHLRRVAGELVWPGFAEMDIPVLLYNEQAAFLTGIENPADGYALPWEETVQGGAWGEISTSDVLGAPVYRQYVEDPSNRIGAFFVKVGDQWTASFSTYEWSRISMVKSMQADFPPALSAVVPYRLLLSLLQGGAERYPLFLTHEMFHVMEATVQPDLLAECKSMHSWDREYPWDDETNTWTPEVELLAAAVDAKTDAEAAQLAGQFLAARQARRTAAGLSARFIRYEQLREWSEGLAKYVELQMANYSATSGYQPLPEFMDDPAFNGYEANGTLYGLQVKEVARAAQYTEEVRFYYTGLGEALLLDRLAPGWKDRALQNGELLEDLLREAVENNL